jgi:hypothetical protein
MIDAGARAASLFLWIVPAGFLVAIALPLLVAPLAWARAFRWRVQGVESDVTVYFGRCTGALALVVILECFRAAPAPRQSPIALELVAAVAVIMTLVHGYGALRRIQPWTEDVETFVYALVGAVAIALRVSL